MKERISKLVDQYGNPIKLDALTKEQAAPTVTGVRKPWHDAVSRGMDPSRLASILQNAAKGDNIAYLSLAEEMEERDTHYASVLSQRKRAVSLTSPVVVGKGDDDRIVQAVEDLISTSQFEEAVDDLLDGIAKGYACVEPIWQRGADLWTPSEYKPRDQRFFQFDKQTGSELRIRQEDEENGREIPLYSMIVHRPKLKSGLPVRGGLARLVSWSFMLKTYTLQDWAAFLETFGMPLRVGKYDDQAGPDEKRTLLRAVRDLGSDAAAIIPATMNIEFIESKGGQGNAVFGAMADYLDKQVSKAVIGQTMTTDDGSSLSQAKIHDDVKLDIKKADCKQLASTIRRDLITPFVAINFGPQAPIPRVTWPVADPEDVEKLSSALSNLVPIGLKVSMKEVRERIGFGEPDEDEEIMVPPVSNAPDTSDTNNQIATYVPSCPGCGTTQLASESEGAEPLVEEALDEWERDLTPLVEQILRAAEEADDFEEFIDGLTNMDPDTNALARHLALQAMKARGDGDSGE